MQIVEFTEENSDPAAIARKKKLFEDLYNQQLQEREQQKKLRQIQNEQTKDPKEWMLTVQSNFFDLYNGCHWLLPPYRV